MSALDEIRQRHSKATPGPYKADHEYEMFIGATHGVQLKNKFINVGRYYGKEYMDGHNLGDVKNIINDTEFFAHSWEDIAYLCDLIERYEKALKPFALLADECDDFCPKGATYTGIDICIADLREARAALAEATTRRNCGS